MVGPYSLLWQLGEGQFGVVWLAERRTSLSTTKFALKLPKPDRVKVGAIEEETKLWVHASGHRNVVPIIEANEYAVERNGERIERKQIIIVSEYVAGGSLEKWLRDQGGRASVELATHMIIEILGGLLYLHERKIIHRDLKPANILLQGETPRIADFGISRALTSSSSYRFTGPIGSLAYMAPETMATKVSKRRISKRTDLWSIGVIFHELLTGTLPFGQRDVPSCIDAIRNAAPAPLPSTIPKPIRDVITRALRKNPEKRYRSAAEMLEALRVASLSAVQPLPQAVQGPSALKRLMVFLKRFRTQGAIIVRNKRSQTFVRYFILILAAAGIISFSWKQYLAMPYTYMEKAKQKLSNGDKRGAIEDLKYVISQDKKSYPEAFLLLGNALYDKKEYQQAIDNYSSFITLRKDDPAGYIGRGLARRIRCECDLAIDDITRAISLKNGDPNYVLMRAEVFAEKGDFENALLDYNRLITIEKTNPKSYVARARLYSLRNNNGDFDNAAQDYGRAIDLENNNASYYLARSEFFVNHGEIDKAIADYDELIAQHRDSAEYLVARGKLHFRKNNIAGGMKDYDQAIKIKSGDPYLYFERARLLYNLGKYDLAIEDWNSFSKLVKDESGSYYNRGLSYLNKGDYKKAVEQFNQGIRLRRDPNYEKRDGETPVGDLYYELGIAYYHDKEYQKALEQFDLALKDWAKYDAVIRKTDNENLPEYKPCSCNPAIDNKPKPKETKAKSALDPGIYYYRGLSLLASNRRDEAIADLKKAIERGGESAVRSNARAELTKLGIK